ncbi:sec1 family domain-containing protein 2 [Lingula anatina]|uniref:Sec1 family domain-containing protein 2 n=1 Tax=Lingula anatina TaxID=7574 RepID=A0A1S3JPG4_LINAN|nr:sec1 family domain-containing protein 2 [Lingula anatina]|eukprot:XP_013412242.1 sec1 family domain-containing protein 2 [Lingula anatina]
MTSVDVGQVAFHTWTKVCDKVRRAVVFVDDACAESLHWNGGLMRLVNAGALNVKEFSSFECAEPSEKKAVFIVSTPLRDVTETIIRDIIQNSQFQYVVVITTQGPLVHLFAKHGSYEGDEQYVFQSFEEKVLEWMGNMNYTAEVLHVPVCTVSVCPSLFVTPGLPRLFPLLPTDVTGVEAIYNSSKARVGDKKSFESLAEIETHHLPKHLQLKVKMLAATLNDVFEELHLQDDPYSVGPFSRLVATELANYPGARHRRKTSQSRASIVCIDRSLDLAGAVSHQGETLLDRILTLLPRLPGHNNDVMVSMADICSAQPVTSDAEEVLAPGCTAHADSSCRNVLATKKHKEALMEVNRQLVEAASSEHLPLSLSGRPGRVTVEQLHSHVKLFKGHPEAIQKHSGLLQVAMATIQAMQKESGSNMEGLLGLEKMLLQSLGDEECVSGLSQVIQVWEREMKKETDQSCRLYTIEDILLLLVYVYSLVGEDAAESEDEERKMMSLLAEAILSSKEEDIPAALTEFVGDPVTANGVTKAIEQVFEKLRSLGACRDDLKQFRTVYNSGSLTSQASHVPVLKQVLQEIFNPAKPDLLDIEHKSSGLKDLLKSGFGLFMNVSKPRPSNSPLLILFIIGGVTASEVKLIKDTVTSYKTGTQVIVGSTKLLKPSDVLDMMFSNPLLES